MKKQVASENQQLLQNILQQWIAFKRYVLKAFGQEPVTPEDEQEFLEVKSQINKIGRILTERMKELGFEGEKIGSMLRQCISVSQLRGMPVADRRGLYKEWHSIYVNLNQAQGAVAFIAEGWVPKIVSTKTGTTIAEIKSQKGLQKAKKKGMGGLVVTLIIAVAVIGAVAFFLLSR